MKLQPKRLHVTQVLRAPGEQLVIQDAAAAKHNVYGSLAKAHLLFGTLLRQAGHRAGAPPDTVSVPVQPLRLPGRACVWLRTAFLCYRVRSGLAGKA